MVGGQESARSLLHLAELFRLADKARVLHDPGARGGAHDANCWRCTAWPERQVAAPTSRRRTTENNEHREEPTCYVSWHSPRRRRSPCAARPRRRTIPGSRTSRSPSIVPWAAGGSTDQVTPRRRRRDREGARPEGRGRQPAAAPRARSARAMRCRRAQDGYTWTAGAAKDLGTYVVSGLLDTKIADWRLYLSVINVVGARRQPNTPYKTAQDLVERHEGEARPGVGRDRRHQLVGPCRDRGVHARARPHLQARVL